ncbi:MAG: serine/threonine-protein kinase, partial [Planctomycetota bacterium]
MLPAAVPPEHLGPYRIDEPIGKGGMGSVYRATHAETGDAVAVKVLDPRLALTEGFRDRFDGEVESLRALRHAGIVRLFGHGEQDGTPFFAMELVDGPSLEEELRAGRRFTWNEATQIGIQVCRALKHAHDHGVIHRDLKPANILLAGDGRPKLADFGIARVFGATGVTVAGGVLGTADYMSPEQAAGKPVTARCDQYSLGCVLYALLAGRPPFRASDLPAMLQLHRFAEAEPVRRFAPDTPIELGRIVAQLLEKDPTDRFPNTLIVARRLEAMSRALAKPAADDFEVYDSSRANEADDPATDPDPYEEMALAATREATADDSTGDPNDLAPAAASDRGSPRPAITSYTQVSADASGSPTAEVARPIVGQAIVLAIALAMLGGGAWWLMRPLSADGLYERIATAVDRSDSGGSSRRWVAEFGERFPDDPRAEEVAGWGRDFELARVQKRLNLNRLGGGKTRVLSPAEALHARIAALVETDPAAAV